MANYALVVNDIHGLTSREDLFFQAVTTYQPDTIILNGDIFGGQSIGSLQKLFYDVKNPMQNGDKSKAEEALRFLNTELRAMGGARVNLEIANCFHYGVFLSLVCWITADRGQLLAQFQEEIVTNVKNFFSQLFSVWEKKGFVILNTGNWEEATPIDYDPRDMTKENKKPYDLRVSGKIKEICNSYKGRVIFNEGFYKIESTAIIGSTAVLDASVNGVGVGVHAEQMVCHYPNEYECFSEHKPSSNDILFAHGMVKWLKELGARTVWHGHIHTEGCQQHQTSYTSGNVTNYVHATKIGVGNYAYIQL